MDVATSWGLIWDERPSEEAVNLNPAFCAELIGRVIGEFHKARRIPLNVAIAFALLPLILHKPTRGLLPGRANAAFVTWIAEHNAVLAELPDRVLRLRPISREALLFALRHRVLRLQDGGLVPGPRPIRLTAKTTPSTIDVDEARRAAGLIGRWFANQGTQSSVLHGMGLSP